MQPVQVETRGYDTHNRVVTDTVSDPTGPTTPITTITSYDRDGHVYQQVSANGDSTVNTYDKAGQLVSTEINTPTVQTATHQTQETYGYDPAGNVTQTVDYDQRVITATFDGDNRLQQSVAVTLTPGAASTITTTPQYDPNGNVLTQTTQTITQTGASPPVETHLYTATYNAADWTTASADDGQVTQYGYDAAGQLRTKTLLNGSTPVTYVLDQQGRATQVGETADGTGPYTTTFAYNLNDLPTRVVLPTGGGGVTQTAQYDANSRITHVDATGPNSGVVTTTLSGATYDYGYNALGWTTSQSEHATGMGTGAHFIQQITHDALGRIIAQSGGYDAPPGGAETWSYDKNGNMTQDFEPTKRSPLGATTWYTYSASAPNELRAQHTDGYGTEYRTYDGRGNTTAISSTDPITGVDPITDNHSISTTLRYDAQQRPLTITVMEKDDCAPRTPTSFLVSTITYAYNALGARSAYTVTPPVGCDQLKYSVRFSYRADGELGQTVTISGTGTSGNPSTTTYTDTFVYDQGGHPLELLRQTAPSTAISRYWYVLDGRGNVVALVDSGGIVKDRYAYDLWGEPKAFVESVPQPLLYAGYWLDQKTGWYWLSVRSYDPEGRFLQPDPSEIEGSRSYVYVGDDPIDATDPSGLDSHGEEDTLPLGQPLSAEEQLHWNMPTLPDYATENDLAELVRDTNKYGTANRLRFENALRALRGPEGTARIRVAGTAGEGADIKFYDKAGRLLLNREVKCLGPSGRSFADRLSEGARQVNGDGEVWIQVHGPQSMNPGDFGRAVGRWQQAIRGFQGQTNRNLTSYSRIKLTVFDTFGRLYTSNYRIGPELIGPPTPFEW